MWHYAPSTPQTRNTAGHKSPTWGLAWARANGACSSAGLSTFLLGACSSWAPWYCSKQGRTWTDLLTRRSCHWAIALPRLSPWLLLCNREQALPLTSLGYSGTTFTSLNVTFILSSPDPLSRAGMVRAPAHNEALDKWYRPTTIAGGRKRNSRKPLPSANRLSTIRLRNTIPVKLSAQALALPWVFPKGTHAFYLPQSVFPSVATQFYFLKSVSP